MKTRVEEIKHKLETVIKNQSASPTTTRFFETFIDEVTSILEQQGKNSFFRTHKSGVTGFCRPRKAFIFVNLYQDQVSIVCFTGGGNIPGLTKGIWLNKDDNKGSETFKIMDEATLRKAVQFAAAAWDLAS